MIRDIMWKNVLHKKGGVKHKISVGAVTLDV